MRLKVFFGDYKDPAIVREVAYVKSGLLKRYIDTLTEVDDIRFEIEFTGE